MIPAMPLEGLPVDPPKAFDPKLIHENDAILDHIKKLIEKQSIHNICMRALVDIDDENNKNKKQLTLIDNQIKVFFVVACSGAIKLIAKIGAREIMVQVGKLYSMEVAELAIKSVSKKIPLAGTLLAAGFSAIRLCNNEPVKAVGEVISGILPWCGNYGKIGSIAIDTLMIIHDANRLLRSTEQTYEEDKEFLTLDSCYKALDVEIANPTKKEVDNAFQKLIMQLHPDHKKEVAGQSNERANNIIINYLTMCKDFICKQKGWN